MIATATSYLIRTYCYKIKAYFYYSFNYSTDVIDLLMLQFKMKTPTYSSAEFITKFHTQPENYCMVSSFYY